MLQPPSACVICHFIALLWEYSSLIVKRMVPNMPKGPEEKAVEEVSSLGAEHFSSAVQTVIPYPRGRGVREEWLWLTGRNCVAQTSCGKNESGYMNKHIDGTSQSPTQRFKIHTFLGIKYLHSTWVADVASFHGRIYIYTGWFRRNLQYFGKWQYVWF